MISAEQLAEVIRDNIEPGEGPLGDLWLDCAKAVLAAIDARAEEDCRRIAETLPFFQAAQGDVVIGHSMLIRLTPTDTTDITWT